MPRTHKTYLELFADKIQIDYKTGCHNWTGWLKADGYGLVTRNGRTQNSHRWIYQELKGPIPAGLEIDHLCRNRACQNTEHMEPVTRAENIRRSERAKFSAGNSETCRSGHKWADSTYMTPEGYPRCRPCNTENARKSRNVKENAA